MGLIAKDDQWRIPDELWVKIARLLPPRPEHPLGCHNPRVPDRDAMNAVLFVLRTGCQWNALNATGICTSSSAHRRFLEWTEAGVFKKAWVRALGDYERFVGIDWRWLSMDGAITKAPLGGEKNRTQPNRPRQGRHQAQPADRGSGRSAWVGGRRRERQRLQTRA
jgi:transposase